MSTTIHILADCQNVVGGWLLLNYMSTPLTHYYLETIGQTVYIETHH
jgi:hypothetical protein